MIILSIWPSQCGWKLVKKVLNCVRNVHKKFVRGGTKWTLATKCFIWGVVKKKKISVFINHPVRLQSEIISCNYQPQRKNKTIGFDTIKIFIKFLSFIYLINFIKFIILAKPSQTKSNLSLAQLIPFLVKVFCGKLEKSQKVWLKIFNCSNFK